MSVVTRATLDDLLQTGLDKVYFKEMEEQPWIYKTMFKVKPSKMQYEETTEVSGFSQASEKSEGSRVTYDIPAQGYKVRLTHRTYATGLALTMESIQDNLYLAAQELAGEHGRSAKRVKEIEHSNILNNGFTANPKFQSGDRTEYLFSATHPLVKAGGNMSNLLAEAAALSEDSLETLINQMDKIKGHAGEYLNLRHRRLIVPTALRRMAYEITQTEMGLHSAEYTKNWQKIQGWEVIDWVYLSSDTAWFIQDARNHGLVSYERMSPITDMNKDPDTLNKLWVTVMRFSGGWQHPWGIAGTTGA